MERTNFTHGPDSFALPIFMFAGGAIGNLIAIFVLSVSIREKKSSAFYTLVCGLAVTDLLGTCLASPLTIADYLDPKVLMIPRVCEFHSFLLLFFGLTGLSIICAMAAERYLAICCPYTYQRWRVDRGFALKFLFLIYISHIFFCCLPAMGASVSELQQSGRWCFINWRTPEPVAAAYCALYGVVSLMLILGTIVLNLAVCSALLLMRRRSARRPVTRGSQRRTALSSTAETQMIAVLVTTSVVVLVCSAPLVIRVFHNCFILKEDSEADLSSIRIAAVNPILDPWIYILLRRSLFQRILGLTRRGRRTRRSSLPKTPVNPFHPEDTAKIGNANITAQLPSTVKSATHNADSLCQTQTDSGRGL
ncbi:prostaglandin E2 receptor EP4 subtype-like [Pungitius pungitius]|uniref:prostaglandin E2 receptor EP4 subtype-like n=1 Tax=Pungitius pungitius TaxID=134920 RepID=UPI00188809FC|nr:prostaglandin E2 receptor EP4 subtype-like [Pungitius pungitius]